MLNRRLAFALVLLVAALLFTPQHAAAQDPTPEPTNTPLPTVTPTPGYLHEMPIEDGNPATIVIERRISYGDIAVFGAVVMLVVILVVNSLIYWGRKWVR